MDVLFFSGTLRTEGRQGNQAGLSNSSSGPFQPVERAVPALAMVRAKPGLRKSRWLPPKCPKAGRGVLSLFEAD